MSGFERFCQEEECEASEGLRGLEHLDKVLQECGYEADDFARGSILENFLRDNSASIEALYEFVNEHFEEQFTDWDYEDCPYCGGKCEVEDPCEDYKIGEES